MASPTLSGRTCLRTVSDRSALDPISPHSGRRRFGVHPASVPALAPPQPRCAALGRSPDFFELQFLYLSNRLKMCLLNISSHCCASFTFPLWGSQTSLPCQLAVAARQMTPDAGSY